MRINPGMPRDRRLGVDITNLEGIDAKVECAAWAERVGYQDCWVAEISDPDAFVVMTAIARATSHMRLGTAIVPIGSRSVPALAAATSSVAEASDGRFALGLGVSSEVIVERWHGGVRGKPLRNARETIELLRHLLSGERSNHTGEYVSSHGFRLRRPHEAPILLAAMNVKMLELAGELADGVLLNFIPVPAVPIALEAVKRGAERAGRSSLPEIILPVVVDVTDDVASATTAFAREIAFYLSAPPYQTALTAYGFGDDVERGRERWAQGDIDHVAAGVSPELVRAIAAIGSVAECRQRIEEYWDAGIDTVSLGPRMGVDARPTIEALAPVAAEHPSGSRTTD